MFSKRTKELIFACDRRGMFNWMPDRLFLKMMFYARMDQHLNLDHPKTFNEKLQWLKLHDRKPVYTTMVDKYEAKKYVAERIGDEYIIPTLGVWDRFDEIDFSKLPNQFVLKCTHDSGGLVICRDQSKLDINAAKEKIDRCMKKNFYWHGREWPYRDVPHRIIAEQYMTDGGEGLETDQGLTDYKFFCFNGTVKFFKVDFDRFIDHRANYFDCGGELLPFGEAVCPPKPERKLELPRTLEKMMTLAEKLASGQPFLRVDFYDVNGKIYFGELTLFPASGMGKFIPEEWDKKIGDLLTLPKH